MQTNFQRISRLLFQWGLVAINIVRSNKHGTELVLKLSNIKLHPMLMQPLLQ
jgi:hypothetical protein